MGELTSRAKKAGLVALALVLASGVGLWLARDVPRSQVVRVLEQALDADVRLGRLEIAAADRFVLHDLRVDEPGRLPVLRRLDIERLEVEGELAEWLDQRIRRLEAFGTRVIVEPTEPFFAPTEEDEAGAALWIGRVLAADAALTFAEPGEKPAGPPARVDIELRDIGRNDVGRDDATAGEVVAEAESLDLGLLLRRFGFDGEGTLDAAKLTWTIESGDTLTGGSLDARGERVSLGVGDLDLATEAPRLQADLGAGTVTITGRQARARSAGAALDLGDLEIRAMLDEPRISAEIDSPAWSSVSIEYGPEARIEARAAGLRLDRVTPPEGVPALDGRGDVQFAGPADGPTVTLDLRPTRVRPPEGEPITLPDGTEARAELSPTGGGEVAFTADARFPGLGDARAEGRFGAKPRPFDLHLEGDLATWCERFAAHLPAAVEGFTVQARVVADLRVDLTTRSAEGPIRLEGFGTSSEDGSRVVEGLGVEATLEARAASEGEPFVVEGSLEGRVAGFEILWGTVYADLSNAGADLRVDASWRDAVARLDTVLTPDDGPTLEVEIEPTLGDAAGQDQGMPYRLRVADNDLGSTYRTYLVPIFGDGATLRRLDGRLALEIEGELAEEAITASGRLALRDASAETADTRVTGLDLVLPIDLRRAASGAVDGERGSGHLAFTRADVRGIEVPAVRSPLRVTGDDIALVEPIVLRLLGGDVSLDRLTLRDALATPTAGLFVETGLRLDGLDLARFSTALDLPALEGRLDGRFPAVRLRGGELEVEGGGGVRLFGGEVTLSEISGREVLSPFPELEFSAEIRDLDLGQLTRRFDFGEMTGILEGRIENCRLFRGTPTAFRARFESVDRRGVSQTVDVKAVKNLTILGTGASPSVLDRGLTSLFSAYRYADLGVEVVLEGDVLLLRGLVHRDDKELFLAGRFPFGIDVVNARPGQTVSFQTMVRRLQTLDTSRVRTD